MNRGQSVSIPSRVTQGAVRHVAAWFAMTLLLWRLLISCGEMQAPATPGKQRASLRCQDLVQGHAAARKVV